MVNPWKVPVLALTSVVLILAVCLIGMKLTTPESSTLEPGPETTRFDVPFRADGTPDYLEYLNEHWLDGVTESNNGAIPLLRDIRYDFLSDERRHKYLDALHVEKADGTVPFVTLSDDLKSKIDVLTRDEIVKAVSGFRLETLTAENRQLVDEWLESQEPVIDVIRQAVAREKFSIPLLREQKAEPLLLILFDAQQQIRGLGYLLTTAAMADRLDGDYRSAVEHLLMCQRLGRLVSSAPTFMQRLVGNAIEKIATDQAEQLVLNDNLSEQVCRDYLKGVEDLPASAPLSEVLSEGERGFMLDLVIGLASLNPAYHNSELFRPRKKDSWLARGKQFLKSVPDTNATLRTINHDYDRIEQALAEEEPVERLRQLAEIEQDIVRSNVHFFGIQLGQILVPVKRMQQSEDHKAIRYQLLQLGLRVRIYQMEHGNYPAQLSELTPAPTKELLLDYYSGQPLKYVRHEKGYFLYCTGPNLNDDQGKREFSRSEDAMTDDDISFGVPIPGSELEAERKQELESLLRVLN